MSFPRYPAYKDSGVAWLGQVPADWTVIPAKYGIASKSGGQATKNTVSPEPGDGLFPAFSASGQDIWMEDFEFDGPALVLSAVGARCGKTFKADGQWGVVANTHCLFPRAAFDRDFLWYLTNREEWWERGGTAQPFVKVSETLARKWAFPPPSEQALIGRFLDRETAKIDALVAEQEQLITLLKEKRQAVISHAVTKGLDSSVPMKDSGVEWLGEVPAHWRTSALKHICDVRDGTHDTPQFLAPSEDTFPFVTTKDLGGGRVSFEEAKHISREDFENFARRSRVDLGDVLMPMIGSIGGAVLVDTGEAFAIKNIALFKGADHFDPRWLTHFLNSDLSSVQFDLNRSGGVQGFVALSVLRDLRIPVPPKIEQVEIADSLSKALANINDLIGLASESIATLQERRATLISAAVTGQIDIRGESNDIKS